MRSASVKGVVVGSPTQRAIHAASRIGESSRHLGRKDVISLTF